MLAALKVALIALISSKKVLTAILGFAASKLLPGLTDEQRMEIVALAGVIVAGFAASDHGKEAAKVTASLAPTKFMPPVTAGGAPQARDDDAPKGGRGDK